MRILLTIVYLTATAPLLAIGDADLPWRFSQRDVYVDGALDRQALVYRMREPDRTLVVSERLRQAIVLNEETLEASEARRRDVRMSADLTRAALVPNRIRAKGSFTRTADGLLAGRVGRSDLVVAPHQSRPGPIDPGVLARDYPVWDKLRDIYEPDRESTARLAAVDAPTELTVVFATWCGDSRREVPRLLRALESAGNPNIHAKLIGLGPDFDPLDFIQARHIINVPTIIVERDGVELGRIVETPSADSVERDLADILSGTPGKHDGRWEREQQIASGRYELTFDDGRRGTESWRLFSTEEGGQLAHSVIDDGILVREVWHRVDSLGTTTFVEVTDRAADTLRRTRYRFGEGELRAHSRGNTSGIIDQTISIPTDCSVVTGSVATAGWSCRLPDRSSIKASVRYTLPLDADSVLGTTHAVRLDHTGEVASERVGIPVRAKHVRSSDASASTDLWIDSDLGIPLRLDGDGVHAELTSLELS